MPRARFDPHDPSHQRPLTSLRHRRVADPSRYGPPSPPSTNPCGPPRGQGVGNARQQVHEGGDNVGTAAAVRPKSPLLPSARPSTAVDNRKFAACPAPAFLRASRVASPLSWRVCRVPVPAPLRPRRLGMPSPRRSARQPQPDSVRRPPALAPLRSRRLGMPCPRVPAPRQPRRLGMPSLASCFTSPAAHR